MHECEWDIFLFRGRQISMSDFHQKNICFLQQNLHDMYEFYYPRTDSVALMIFVGFGRAGWFWIGTPVLGTCIPHYLCFSDKDARVAHGAFSYRLQWGMSILKQK